MDNKDTIIIKIRKSTKQKLDELKIIPRESYNEIIVRLLDEVYNGIHKKSKIKREVYDGIQDDDK